MIRNKFWANPTADWRIKAGLSQNNMMVFRQMACKQVEPGDHDGAPTLTGAGDTFLYQAYVGRVQVSTGDTLKVFVDDEAIQTGSVNTLVGNTCRTWYDGLSYAGVASTVVSVATIGEAPVEFNLAQNYPNPFNPGTTIWFSVPTDGDVSMRVYDLLGKEVATLIDGHIRAGTHNISWNARNLPSGAYFYRITVGSFSRTRMMTLLR